MLAEVRGAQHEYDVGRVPKARVFVDVLACKCGGRRKVIASVRDAKQIERFLRHVQLWPDSQDIVSICGPPAMFAALEVESLDPWDDLDAPQPLDWVA